MILVYGEHSTIFMLDIGDDVGKNKSMLDTSVFDEDRVMVYNDILMFDKDMVHEKDKRYGKKLSHKIKSELI